MRVGIPRLPPLSRHHTTLRPECPRQRGFTALAHLERAHLQLSSLTQRLLRQPDPLGLQTGSGRTADTVAKVAGENATRSPRDAGQCLQ